MQKKELKEKFDEWIIYLKEIPLRENTIKLYERAIKVFIEYLDANAIDEITKKDVNDYIESMKDEIKHYESLNSRQRKALIKKLKGKRPLGSLTTAQIRIRVLNNLFEYANHNELKGNMRQFDKDGDADVRDDDTNLSDLEYLQILDKAKELGKDRLVMIIESLAYTGCRISELQYFTVENVKKRKVSVTNKGKSRTVYISSSLKRKLLNYCSDHDIKSGIIFHSRDRQGNPIQKMISQSNLRKELKDVSKQINGFKTSKAHFHIYRHFFCDHFVKMDGYNPYYLSKLVGHSSIDGVNDTTSIYIKPTTKEFLELIDDVNRFIDQELKKAQKIRAENKIKSDKQKKKKEKQRLEKLRAKRRKPITL